MAVGGDSMLAGIEAPVGHERFHGIARDAVSRIRDVTKVLSMTAPSGTMKKSCLTLKPWEGDNFGAKFSHPSFQYLEKGKKGKGKYFG